MRELVRHLQDAGNKILDAQQLVIELSDDGKIDPSLDRAFDGVLNYLKAMEEQLKTLEGVTA